MFERLLQIGFNRTHSDAETPGDFAMRYAIEPRRDKDPSPPVRQFGDDAPEQVDLGPRLRNASRIRSIVSDVDQAVGLGLEQLAFFRPPAIMGNVDRYAQEIGLRTPASGLIHPLKAQIGFLKDVGSKIDRSEATGEPPGQLRVIGHKQITQCIPI